MDSEEFTQIEKCLKQEKLIKSSLANGDGPWTIVCDNWDDDSGNRGGRYIALSQPQLRNQILSRMGWDLTKGRGIPGFMGSKEDAQYFRNDAAPDFEPLVIFQEFHGVVPDPILISEEFCLLMELWRDPKSGNYFQVKDDGSKEPAIRFDKQKVEVRTPILKRYLAARQLDAVLFVDSVTSVPTTIPSKTFEHLEIEDCSNGICACLARNIDELSVGKLSIRCSRAYSLNGFYSLRLRRPAASGHGTKPHRKTTRSLSSEKMKLEFRSNSPATLISWRTTSEPILTHPTT